GRLFESCSSVLYFLRTVPLSLHINLTVSASRTCFMERSFHSTHTRLTVRRSLYLIHQQWSVTQARLLPPVQEMALPALRRALVPRHPLRARLVPRRPLQPRQPRSLRL